MMRRIFFTLALLILPASTGFSVGVNDRDMKAALIYNFAVYTTWPESSTNHFNICVYEEDAENITQEILESKRINGKPIRYVVLNGSSSPETCQVLYIEDARRTEDPKFVESISGTSLLTIADVTKRPSLSGIVNIQLQDRKYLFTINNEAAKQHNLVFSSRLLRLASKVF